MDFAKLLNDNGLKATFQRTQILGVIEKSGHINIDKIYEEVTKVHPSLSLATIYKNILLMVEKGVLVEVPIVADKSKYEIKKEEHMHFICEKCGIVADAPINWDLLNQFQQDSFDINRINLSIYGLCGNCKL